MSNRSLCGLLGVVSIGVGGWGCWLVMLVWPSLFLVFVVVMGAVVELHGAGVLVVDGAGRNDTGTSCGVLVCLVVGRSSISKLLLNWSLMEVLRASSVGLSAVSYG